MPQHFPRRFDSPADAVVVDCANGSDHGAGTVASPLKTLQAGVAMAQARRGKTVAVRGGTCYVDAAVQVTAQDSGLTLQNYEGEEAWVSGGVPLNKIVWEPHK